MIKETTIAHAYSQTYACPYCGNDNFSAVYGQRKQILDFETSNSIDEFVLGIKCDECESFVAQKQWDVFNPIGTEPDMAKIYYELGLMMGTWLAEGEAHDFADE